MNSLDYLLIQLRLEGKEVVHRDLLRQVQVIPGEEMLLMIIVQFGDKKVTPFYDEALSTELREKLRGHSISIEFSYVNRIVHFLQSYGFTVEAGHYKTYVFPDSYKRVAFEEVRQFSKDDSKVQAFGFDGFAGEIYGIKRDEKIVSACVSARENDFCGEAWVYTDEQYRHQGFSKKVVSVWARNLMTANKIPFYSHKIENTASASLAKRLGLQPVFEEIAFSRLN